MVASYISDGQRLGRRGSGGCTSNPSVACCVLSRPLLQALSPFFMIRTLMSRAGVAHAHSKVVRRMLRQLDGISWASQRGSMLSWHPLLGICLHCCSLRPQNLSGGLRDVNLGLTLLNMKTKTGLGPSAPKGGHGIPLQNPSCCCRLHYQRFLVAHDAQADALQQIGRRDAAAAEQATEASAAVHRTAGEPSIGSAGRTPPRQAGSLSPEQAGMDVDPEPMSPRWTGGTPVHAGVTLCLQEAACLLTCLVLGSCRPPVFQAYKSCDSSRQTCFYVRYTTLPSALLSSDLCFVPTQCCWEEHLVIAKQQPNLC